MSRKIDEINKGLHKVEKMLQQKSKSIEKAQEIQKVTFSFNFLQRLVFPLFIPHRRACFGINLTYRDLNPDPQGAPLLRKRGEELVSVFSWWEYTQPPREPRIVNWPFHK